MNKRLLVIPDIHDRVDSVQKICQEAAKDHETEPFDLILLVGDFTSKNPRGEAPDWAIRQNESFKDIVLYKVIGKYLPTVPVVFVPGNHDWPYLGKQESTNIDGRVAKRAGMNLFGIGGSPTFHQWPYEWSEGVLAQHLNSWYPKDGSVDIILSHCPPRGCGAALTKQGVDAGSYVIEELAKKHHGLLVNGHIHEANGLFVVGNCTIVNAGALGSAYPACWYVKVNYDPNLKQINTASFKDLDGKEASKYYTQDTLYKM